VPAWGILLAVEIPFPRKRIRVPFARVAARWLALVGLLAFLPACGAILGIEAGTLEDAGATDEAGRAPLDAERPQDTGKAKDASKVDAGSVVHGDGGPVLVFVSADGSASTPCGTKAKPCLTVHDGVATAAAEMAPHAAATVWVAAGNYTESVSLVSGISIAGGFGPSWTLPDAGEPTTITGETGATITIKNATGPVTLSNLTLQSTTSPGPSESVYGVFATSDADAGAQVTLENVFVRLGPAGSGTVGHVGAVGDPAEATCSTSGSGATGEPGPGAQNSGTFSIDGFTPTSGSSGMSGATGGWGNVGTQGCAKSCIAGCNAGFCVPTPSADVCAPGGPAGCGGGGGAGGGGGGGGGSSIALFAWNVPVTVEGGLLGAGNGGDGAPGGVGGPGAPGGAGSAPQTAMCPTSCAYSSMGVCSNTDGTAMSQSGTVGAQGGTGGPGGPGAGGSSYSVYSGGSAVLSLSGTVMYAQGSAGTGTPNGTAAQQGAFAE